MNEGKLKKYKKKNNKKIKKSKKSKKLIKQKIKGFARYYGYEPVDKLYPEWEIFNQLLVRRVLPLLIADVNGLYQSVIKQIDLVK